MDYTTLSQIFVEGTILGVGTGIVCAVFCIPVLIGLNSRNVNNISIINDTLFFLFGRFIAYIFVAVFFSFIGIQIKHISLLKIISKFVISGLMIYWGIKGILTIDNPGQKCYIKKFTGIIPITAGIITGLSPCPPFIAGITRIIDMGNITKGIVFFMGFYIMTSIFLLPGLLTGLAKYKKEIKITSCFVSIIFGLVFFVIGISSAFS